MKQTAVEWLVYQLYPTISIRLNDTYIKELIEQAKAMEKEQILNAYGEGFSNGNRINFRNRNEYYNETYNNTQS
jgi:hypothetical protein